MLASGYKCMELSVEIIPSESDLPENFRTEITRPAVDHLACTRCLSPRPRGHIMAQLCAKCNDRLVCHLPPQRIIATACGKEDGKSPEAARKASSVVRPSEARWQSRQKRKGHR